MKKLLTLLLLIIKIGTAQNLVPNPSFELYNNCPSMLANLSDCAAWQNFGETPDYFNTCGTNCLQVPDVCFGYQIPKSGNAYAGFISVVVGIANYREYLGIQLSNTLVIGTKYYLSIYVSNGGKSAAMLGSNKIGARFSTVSFTQSNPPSLTNWAHIYTDSIITDTLNWVQIKGSFIADSTYQYLVIGNFFNDSNTNFIKYGLFNQQGYYFIDDVCLSPDSILCTSVASLPLNEIGFSGLTIKPNPTDDYIFLTTNFITNYEVIIYNSLSQEVYHNKTIFNDIRIDTQNWKGGVYFIYAKSNEKLFSSKFIIKH